MKIRKKLAAMAAAASLSVLSAAPVLAAAPAEGEAGEHGAAAHGAGDHGSPWEAVGIHAFNFALLVGLLYYFGRRPVGDYLRNRRTAAMAEIEESARLREEARRRYEEYDRRLRAFDQEVKQLVDRVREECQVEHDLAIRNARQAAEAMLQTTRRAIEEETRRARYELRREAIDLSVSLAAQALRAHVTSEDQRRLADNYLQAVGGALAVRSEVAES